MIFIDIAGGVALILFGVRFLRKGFERIPGQGLHGWIERMARRPGRATLGGAAVGAVAPSSTAQTLLSIQLVKSSRLPVEWVLPFLLGADIGITTSVQLIALHLYDLYPLFLVAGLIGFQFCRRELLRGIGQIILGLGFIYLAMSVMGEAAHALSADKEFAVGFAVLPRHRLLLVLFAALLTFVMQSSTATIGLALAFAEAGGSALPLMLPVVLGANLGIALISGAVGWPTAEGRQLAAGNIALKSLGIVLALWFFGPLAELWARMPWGVARQSADFHTAFNLAVALVGIAVTSPLNRLLGRFFSPKPQPRAAGAPSATHLDPSALSSPVFALANAGREMLRMADEVRGMYAGAWKAFVERDEQLAREVRSRDDRVDELHGAIKRYLSQLSGEAMTPRDARFQLSLLNFASELESLGDTVDKSLCGAAIRCARDKPFLAPEDLADLQALYERVRRRMEQMVSALTTRDRALARGFLQEGEELEKWCVEAEKRHFQRLDGKDRAMTASTEGFLQMLNVLRRISGQLSALGHTFLAVWPQAVRPAAH